jgi:hypothetical protein
MSGIDGRYSVANDPMSHGRLKSPCASIMSVPYDSHPTPSPVRNAATTSGAAPPSATIERQIAAIAYGLSGSTSASA